MPHRQVRRGRPAPDAGQIYRRSRRVEESSGGGIRSIAAVQPPQVVSGPAGRPWCVPPEPEPFPYDPEVVAGAHRPNMGGINPGHFSRASCPAGVPGTAPGAAGVEMLTTELPETGHRRREGHAPEYAASIRERALSPEGAGSPYMAFFSERRAFRKKFCKPNG